MAQNQKKSTHRIRVDIFINANEAQEQNLARLMALMAQKLTRSDNQCRASLGRVYVE